MKLGVLKMDGSKAEGQVELKKEIFGIEPREHVVYLAVKAEMANKRQGSASTLTRGQVKGSGIKLFRQKGTGRARVGDAASPIRYGGGVAFGPHPRSYRQKVNQKARLLARKSLLSSMQRDSRIILVDTLELAEPKTKLMAQALDALGLEGRKLVILTAEPSETLWRASRNLPWVAIKPAKDVSSWDLWSTDFLLVDKAGLKALQSALN